MTATAKTTEEQECWECWNVFRVLRSGLPRQATLPVQFNCPYCGSTTDFDRSVASVEAIDIDAPHRRVRQLSRRLQNAGGELVVRVRERRRAVRTSGNALEAARSKIEQLKR